MAVLPTVVVAACSFVFGSAITGLAFAASKKPEEKSKDENIHFSFEYTAHPEEFIRYLEEDLMILKDDDRLSIRISFKAGQGWTQFSKYTPKEFPLIVDKKSRIAKQVKRMLCEPDSPLIKRTEFTMTGGYQELLTEIYGDRRKFFWKDKDSPLYFVVQGTIKPKVKIEGVEEEISPSDELIEAIKEVESIGLPRSSEYKKRLAKRQNREAQ